MIAKLKFKVESPVHIGSGETYIETDFIANNNKIRIIDYEKLFEMVEFSEEFVEKLKLAAETGEVKNKIPEIFGIDKKDIPFSRDIEFVGKIPNRSLKIQKHIQSIGRAYIPGSTIKGFIRTAVLYKFLEEYPDILAIELSKLKNRLRDQRRASRLRKSAAKEIEKVVFGSNPNKDIFRSMRITDSSFAGETSVYEVKIIGNPQSIPVYLECINPGEILLCTLQFDEFIETDGKLRELTIDYVLESIDAFVSVLLKEEKRYGYSRETHQFYSSVEGKKLMRLGHSTGYFTKTIGLIVRQFDEFEGIRKIFGMGKNPVTKRVVKNFPKTRRITANGLPLGWLSFDRVI